MNATIIGTYISLFIAITLSAISMSNEDFNHGFYWLFVGLFVFLTEIIILLKEIHDKLDKKDKM